MRPLLGPEDERHANAHHEQASLRAHAYEAQRQKDTGAGRVGTRWMTEGVELMMCHVHEVPKVRTRVHACHVM